MTDRHQHGDTTEALFMLSRCLQDCDGSEREGQCNGSCCGRAFGSEQHHAADLRPNHAAEAQACVPRALSDNSTRTGIAFGYSSIASSNLGITGTHHA